MYGVSCNARINTTRSVTGWLDQFFFALHIVNDNGAEKNFEEIEFVLVNKRNTITLYMSLYTNHYFLEQCNDRLLVITIIEVRFS